MNDRVEIGLFAQAMRTRAHLFMASQKLLVGMRERPCRAQLLGWGSNLHGQLGQNLCKLHIAEPTEIDCADSLVWVTGSQVLYSRQGILYLFGYMPQHENTSIPRKYHIPWREPRAILGQDEIKGCIDNDGYLCIGFTTARHGSDRWRHAAMDKTGRIVAVSGMSVYV